MRFVKRALLVIPVAIALLMVAYGYAATRRERLYRHLVVEGDSALAKSDIQVAVSAFGEAITLKPESMLGYLKRGDAHRRLGNLDAAAVDLEKARSLSPTEPRAFELLGDVATLRQMHVQAAEYYSAFVKLDDRPRAFYKLGLARYMAGNEVEAIDSLRQAVKMDNRFGEAHYVLGLCLRAMKRLPAAQSAFEHAVAVSPNLIPAREQLADLYGALGRRPERIKQLEDLMLADASAMRQVALALAYSDSGQVQRAIRMLRVAADLYPTRAATFLALGKVWLEVSVADDDRIALGKAIEALRQAVSLEPSSAALTLLGRARLMASDTAAAEQTLRRATETLPVEAAAFLHLADAADVRGGVSTARRALLDYQALTGATEAEFLVRLAHAHWRSGDINAARTTVSRVLEKDPDNPRARDLDRLLR